MPSRPLLQLVAVLGCFGLAAAVSFTTPFTAGADLVTAVALVAMLVAQIALFLREEHRRRIEVPPRHRGGVARYLTWIALCVCVTVFELYNYFESPRSAHPTLSSLSDELTGQRLGKAVLFVAWLALGWLFLLASSRRTSPEP